MQVSTSIEPKRVRLGNQIIAILIRGLLLHIDDIGRVLQITIEAGIGLVDNRLSILIIPEMHPFCLVSAIVMERVVATELIIVELLLLRIIIVKVEIIV